jgi:hypothetical protein
MLARGAVFPAEFETRDVGVTEFALLRSGGCEVLDVGIGKSRAGLTVTAVGS